MAQRIRPSRYFQGVEKKQKKKRYVLFKSHIIIIMKYPSFTRATKKRITKISSAFHLYHLFLPMFLSIGAKFLNIDREKEA